VGLSTLAVAVGEEADTVETVAEPYLVREGFIVRTPRGRAAAPRAWRHLGIEQPRSAALQDALPLASGDDPDDAPGAGGRFGG
jgi:Holliday junction DNA helicase RuvB